MSYTAEQRKSKLLQKMKIERVEFKNFASYGNKVQSIDLTRDGSLTQIVGLNGAGKSTIADVIKFALYGKVDKKTLKDIPNRINKNAWVRVELVSNNKRIVVERGLEPSMISLTVDGVPFDKANAKVSPTDYLVDELLELPYYVFNNTSILSANDFKSFLRMTPKDKREIIYKVFGFTIINLMKDILNKQMKTMKEQLDTFIGSLGSLQGQLDNSYLQLEALNKKLLENSDEELKITKAELDKYVQVRDLHESKKSAFLTEERNFRITLSEYTSLVSKTRAELVEIKKKLNLYDNSKCPTCTGDLGTEFHLSLKQELQLELEKIDGKYQGYITSYNSMKEKEKELERDKAEFYSRDVKIRSKLETLNQAVKKLEASTSDTQAEYIQKIIDDCTAKIEENKKYRDNAESKVAWMKFMDTALGEQGIKQMAMRTITPSFNMEIFKMMQQMHLDYTVTFNEEFDATVCHLGEEISPATLSFGESKKVDFVILVSFIRLMKLKYPSMNLLFLDEIFASVDPDGIHSILEILSGVSKELGLNIFVISWTPLPHEVFDYKISIEKKDNFSNLAVEKV